MQKEDAYAIGFWLEHTKHTIIEDEKVKGKDGVMDLLNYLLKLLTKNKLVKSRRSELRDYLKQINRKYHGKQRLNESDHNDIISLLERLDDGISAEIEKKKSKTGKPTRIRLAHQSKEKIYRTGHTYEVYQDLREIVENANSNILVIDSYPNEEWIDLYLNKAKKNNVRIRILLKDPKGNFDVVAKKFHLQLKERFEVRQHEDVHDRLIFVDNSCYVMGQSAKDAGKKPTYLVRIGDYGNFRRTFEELWEMGIRILPEQT